MDRNLTAEEQAILKDKVKVAKNLARKHFEIEPGMTEIFSIWDRPKYEARLNTPIKLLEVDRNTIASGIQPLAFDPIPSAGIRYPSVIVVVTPEEFLKIRSRELPLPPGWTIGEPLPGRPRGRRQ